MKIVKINGVNIHHIMLRLPPLTIKRGGSNFILVGQLRKLQFDKDPDPAKVEKSHFVSKYSAWSRLWLQPWIISSKAQDQAEENQSALCSCKIWPFSKHTKLL